MTTQLEPIAGAGEGPNAVNTSGTAIGARLRYVAAVRAEGALGELPKIARRLATLLLVLSICIPVFVVVLAVILWHLLA